MDPNIERGDTVDRRGFLKKAGTVAWTVPAIQVVNMTGALAGTANTSVTTTTAPPPGGPGDCVDVYYRLKAEWQNDGWVWVKGEGNNDCLVDGEWADLIPEDLAVSISGDDEEAVVKHELPDCEISQAVHKAANNCVKAEIGDKGEYAKFTKVEHGISHVELIVKCCVIPG